VIPQHVVAGSRKRIPDIEEPFVTILWHTEITDLDNEINLGHLHLIHKDSEAIIRIVHNILVNIGDDPKTERFGGVIVVPSPLPQG
jgi:hypothetical protein